MKLASLGEANQLRRGYPSYARLASWRWANLLSLGYSSAELCQASGQGRS